MYSTVDGGQGDRALICCAGQYNVPAGLGRQVYSTKKSSGAVRFGSAGRDAAQKIYLSPEHDRAAGSGASPGPTTSNPRPAYGPQQLSRHARWAHLQTSLHAK